ncbi:putative bifunctional diguanylate cyclase/phosphodiesterase [Qipengyuania sp.]|uniref:putative bifunctional diguanylate cyclase/phosphodiesterase n=1 Tax=Qipengyuania sp. TaxID=2004515 RepID=UPI003AF4C83D
MIGFESENQVAAAFGRERIKAVRDVIHLYYLTILAPFAGFAWIYRDQTVTKVVGAILVFAVVLRFRHWSSPPVAGESEDVNPVAARVTGAMVVLLSTAQAAFYISIGLFEAEQSPGDLGWGPILALGMLAALIQGAALTGIIFASRVIFFCFVLPMVLTLLYLFVGVNLPASIAVVFLTAVGLLLSEASHRIQLRLFKAQYDADQALIGMEKTHLKLINARRQAQHQAETDSLTGVRSRFAFIRDVEAQLTEGQTGLLAVIDLDRFKPINDLYGHHAGDVVLRHVARRLKRALPSGTIVGRLGGDEFGLFRGGITHADGIAELVAQCDEALVQIRRPMRLSSALVSIGGSAGARVLGSDAVDVGRALRDADAALYVAKREGLEATKLFDDVIRDESEWLHTIEAELMRVDAVDEMSLVYQPILNLRTGELASFEALARWCHPTHGEISPALFIPAAERLGRITDITLGMLEKALAFAADWDLPCRLSFNLSAAHICCEDAARNIVELIERCHFPSHRLQFEITETAMLVNFEVARANVEILREAGCRMVLDDFGAGFASLVYLREISFDKVKIDGSLIRGARVQQGRDMLRGVIQMINSMKLESVAEFIECRADYETALELGAEFGQGFYLGSPIDELGARELLERHREPQSEKIRSLVNRPFEGPDHDGIDEFDHSRPYSMTRKG